MLETRGAGLRAMFRASGCTTKGVEGEKGLSSREILCRGNCGMKNASEQGRRNPNKGATDD